MRGRTHCKLQNYLCHKTKIALGHTFENIQTISLVKCLDSFTICTFENTQKKSLVKHFNSFITCTFENIQKKSLVKHLDSHNMYIWKHTKKISGEISRLFHKMYIWKHTKKISGEISRIFHNIYSTNWECFEHLIWYQRTSLYEHNFEQYISCILGVFSSS